MSRAFEEHGADGAARRDSAEYEWANMLGPEKFWAGRSLPVVIPYLLA